MATLLLLLIYVAFISLGLPDAMLGASWPVMQPDFDVPYGFAGFVQIVVSGGTIISSMFSGSMIKRFGTGKLTALSVAFTAVALIGFSIVPSFWFILAVSVPLGLGAGSVDAALNAYVANHYESRHMSWLHSFWGVGALSGPLIMSAILFGGFSWRTGYRLVGSFQIALVIVLLVSIPLWDKVKARKTDTVESDGHLSLSSALKIRGVKLALLVFLFYCGVEANMILWAGSYLYMSRGMEPPLAASWVSLFLTSITAGRFLTGFLTFKVSNNRMILTGILIIFAGVILMLFPLPLQFALTGILLVGFGCAPIFPCMLHETPVRFGSKASQSIMGFQMASAYIGTTFLPPLVGFITSYTSMALLPLFVFLFSGFLLLSFIKLRQKTE
ncbi:MAG: MFS transporter [Fibrobacter sp.]|nr:MFS transporter [Fibrobacter sp.]